MGPAELGIWDFGWTLRSIIAVSSLEMGSSGGHYVSRFRAVKDWDGLNKMLSAMLALLLYTAVLGLAITVTLAMTTQSFIKDLPPDLVTGARWMVLGMGAAAAVEMITAVYAGVLVGSHRFDLVNLVEIVADVGVIAALFTVILAGLGLKMMAVCVLVRTVFDLIAKAVMAHRLCPHLRLRPRWTDRQRFGIAIGYGSKTMAQTVATMVLNQAAVATILVFQGPIAVAMYSRPRALIRFTTRFLMGFARVLVPKASELYEKGDRKRLGELLISSTRLGLYLTLPLSSLLLIMGGPLLLLWMGEDYADPTVLTILVVGYLAFFSQISTWHMLLGIGAHGLVSVANLCGAGVAVGLLFIFVGKLGWGSAGAAVSVAIPVTIVNLFIMPYSGCKKLGVPISKYLVRSTTGPVLAAIPIVMILVACRILFTGKPIMGLLIGVVLCGPILAIIWWRWALPESAKEQARAKLRTMYESFSKPSNNPEADS